MIVVVLLKSIASTYLQGAVKLLQKVDFFVIDVCKNVTLICFQVCKILWQVPLLTLKSYLLL